VHAQQFESHSFEISLRLSLNAPTPKLCCSIWILSVRSNCCELSRRIVGAFIAERRYETKRYTLGHWITRCALNSTRKLWITIFASLDGPASKKVPIGEHRNVKEKKKKKLATSQLTSDHLRRYPLSSVTRETPRPLIYDRVSAGNFQRPHTESSTYWPKNAP
jgi:hypothetical protein